MQQIIDWIINWIIEWKAWLIAGAVLFIVIPGFIVPTFVAIHQFRKTLVRRSKEQWSRNCSWIQDPEQAEMFRRGEKWAENFKDCMRDVDIVNDGFHLFGEYFDIGSKKAVIIIPGRTEGCHYSHYFAKPYTDSGYNVLTIDNRSHGLSEGKYNCLGLKEYSDILAWGKMLHDDFGIEEIFLHGICIGSATAVQALATENVPDYFTGIAVDGIYKSFYYNFKNHIRDQKHPTFPVLEEVMLLIKLVCGVDAVHNGPMSCINRVKKPVLFLHSKKDVYSLPDECVEVYEKCASPKKLVWFEKGGHSHIRINNEESYDKAIIDFLAEKDTLEENTEYTA